MSVVEMSSKSSAKLTWEPCCVEPQLGVAFFDGIKIKADAITDTRDDRVLPVLEEEHVYICRLMKERPAVMNKIKQGALILNMNAGNGVFSIWAARQGCHVVALVDRPRALSIFRDNAKNENSYSGLIVNTWDRISKFRLSHLDPVEPGNPGRIDIVQCEPEELADEFRHRFDLVFMLVPPYNPTCCGANGDQVRIARYAGAGENGQEVFDKQIIEVPVFLKDNGVCVGHQMSLVRRDETERDGAKFQRPDAINKIEGAFKELKESVRIDYARLPILNEAHPDDPDRNLETFLREQYRWYLRDDTLTVPSMKDVEAYIGKWTADYEKLSLIYFEVHRASERPGVQVFENPFQISATSPHFNWDYRISLHQEAVEHTSDSGDLSIPWLFMRTDPAMSEINIQEPVHKKGGQCDNGSFLWTFGEWLKRSQLLKKLPGSNASMFQVLYADATPYYPLAQDELKNEAQVWYDRFVQDETLLVDLKNQDLYQDLIVSWTNVTRTLQHAEVGMWLHDHFTGANAPDQWAEVLYSKWDSEKFDREFTSSQSALLNLSEKKLKEAITRYPQQKAMEEARKILKSSDWEALGIDSRRGYKKTPLSALTFSDVDEYRHRIHERVREINSERELTQKEQKDQVRADAQVCHWLGHRQFHDALNKVLEQHGHDALKCSIFVAIPLSLSSDMRDAQKLSHYRGGIWLLAGSRDEWTLQHEQTLLDAARYLWLLSNGQYNVDATEHISQMEKRDAEMRGQAALATYARGASHSLKNAVTLPSWRLNGLSSLLESFSREGGWGDMMDHSGLAPVRQRMEAVLRGVAPAESDMEFLRRQTETMFWIMDPDRMGKELMRSVDTVHWEDISLLKLVTLACAGAVRKVTNEELGVDTELEKNNLIGAVLETTDKVPENNKIPLSARFSATLTSALRNRVKCKIEVESLTITTPDYRIAENVVFELIVNAMTRALTAAASGCKSRFVFSASQQNGNLEILLGNTAPGEDVKSLMDTWRNRNMSVDSGSRGVSGLLQIQILCDKAAEAKRVARGKADIDADRKLALQSRLALIDPYPPLADKAKVKRCLFVHTGLIISGE